MGKRSTNGSGCYRPYKYGGYEYRLQHGYKQNGKPNILTTLGKTKTECREKMKKKLEQITSVPLSIEDCSKITLTELCYKHLNEHLSEKDRLKGKSADRREGTIRNQIEKYPIGKLQVAAVTFQDVNRHIEGLINDSGLSLSSIEKAFDVINSAYNWAISQQMLMVNPCNPIKDKLKHRFSNLEDKHSTDSDIIVLSDEEIEKLKSEAAKLDERGKPIYQYGPGTLFILATALRSIEYCALRLSDWDREAHTISITKTRGISKDRNAKYSEPVYTARENIVKNNHARELVLSEEAEKLLKEICKNSGATNPDDYVQINSEGKPTEPSRFGTDINKIYKNAGLGKDVSGVHILRRTYATIAHENGASTLDIAAYLGDDEKTVIKHYIATRKRIRVGNQTRNVVPLPKHRLEK